MCSYLWNIITNCIGNKKKREKEITIHSPKINKNDIFYITFYINNKILKLYSFNESYNEGLILRDVKLNKKIIIKENNIYKISKKRVDYFNILKLLYYNNIENIIIPYKIYENINNEYIIEVSKYKKHGDLFNFILNNDLKYYEIYNIIFKINNIINDLHNIDITHRDLKLENFIIDYKNDVINILLIDFDFANYQYKECDFKGGTRQYAAPELFEDDIINNFKSVDILSFTVILYILLFKEFPWEEATDYCTLFRLHQNNPYNIIYHIFTLNIPLTHKILYSNIIKYGFNLNHKHRQNLSYINSLFI